MSIPSNFIVLENKFVPRPAVFLAERGQTRIRRARKFLLIQVYEMIYHDIEHDDQWSKAESVISNPHKPNYKAISLTSHIINTYEQMIRNKYRSHTWRWTTSFAKNFMASVQAVVVSCSFSTTLMEFINPLPAFDNSDHKNLLKKVTTKWY